MFIVIVIIVIVYCYCLLLLFIVYCLLLLFIVYVVVYNRWIPDCSEVFRTHKDSWSYLIPPSSDDRPILAEHFFNTACSLMAKHLRTCVEESIHEMLSFLNIYKVKHYTCIHIHVHVYMYMYYNYVHVFMFLYTVGWK